MLFLHIQEKHQWSRSIIQNVTSDLAGITEAKKMKYTLHVQWFNTDTNRENRKNMHRRWGKKQVWESKEKALKQDTQCFWRPTRVNKKRRRSQSVLLKSLTGHELCRALAKLSELLSSAGEQPQDCSGISQQI